MIIASVIGSGVTLLLIHGFDPWTLVLIPLGGSVATVFVIALFQAIGFAIAARANARAASHS